MKSRDDREKVYRYEALFRSSFQGSRDAAADEGGGVSWRGPRARGATIDFNFSERGGKIRRVARGGLTHGRKEKGG